MLFTGAFDLSSTVASTTLPANVASGSTAHGSVTVDVTNTGGSPLDSSETVNVFASSDGSIDGSSIKLGSLTRTLKIPANATAPLSIPIKSLPASLDGT